jgi:hypothetical protein
MSPRNRPGLQVRKPPPACANGDAIERFVRGNEDTAVPGARPARNVRRPLRPVPNQSQSMRSTARRRPADGNHRLTVELPTALAHRLFHHCSSAELTVDQALAEAVARYVGTDRRNSNRFQW